MVFIIGRKNFAGNPTNKTSQLQTQKQRPRYPTQTRFSVPFESLDDGKYSLALKNPANRR